MQVLTNVKIYTGEGVIENGFIRYNEQIQTIGNMEQFVQEKTDIVTDGQGKLVIPGMIDCHLHGGYHFDAMDADSDALVKFSNDLMKEGVTTFFPTTMTQSIENITKALEACKEAKEKGAHFEAIHLEGPFVNYDWKGAQPGEYVINPDVALFKKWQEASGNLIKLVTYAPETEGARELEAHFEETGVIGTCGHTGAYYKDLVGRNIKHGTHLFNQMRGLHHREPGVVGYVLLTPGVKVEIITDGIHVCPEMVKLAYKMKGAEDILVITDAMRAKGLEEGEYELGGQPVFVKDGKATLADGTLAGSVLTMDAAFRNVIEFTGCTIEEAVLMTSVNQAKHFGFDNKGTLTVGKDADFVLMTEELYVHNTICLGKGMNA
ncbi:N-acetylglucosamine-6-phosphate deacetylase [Priestia taiwanensis]|uniref:N-acetylglucosamine-6-phosphate deacetylase n=1 Tax=Priestia taiwanensis TaxID=1347902 RepID=A0A917ARV6_9BACI|nr:N-acetylglucosamine-6-phosphate deacetylase [Priestia taiwanensis]MBM7363871.1 N-acetylglucosamine-6-phosphate deacetylase [Priestia taiwanensis]GGE69685.1 N-acetylglucosamine-6-phosphate deacetylase [Priestia taiwanensis]